VVLEEPDACIELQLPEHSKVRGRLDGTVPAAGELSPEIVSHVLTTVLTDLGFRPDSPPDDPELEALVKSLALPVHRPRLCPGCAHRSAFFAIKREFGSRAIFPGDIGCYTLGINQHAVDTCVNMGASVSMAIGFYQANQLVGDDRPVIATIGDSTFLHSGVEPLIEAVHTGARFVLVILDNRTTAMTGFQPTAASEIWTGEAAKRRQVSIADLARACGAGFVEMVDPYEQETFRSVLRTAQNHCRAPDGGVAVVIAERSCILCDSLSVREEPKPVVITESCDGCGYCLDAFGCPALVSRPNENKVQVDSVICVECGQCIGACPKGCILPQPRGAERPDR
jgi:indolepyruvate ferredoxin oxidoreductase alpha subunit